MYKVLLVDDERIILEGISKIIDWGAYGTVLAGTARNGLEAYEFIAAHQPDIVITDIRMPGMDGLQLVEKVRENDRHVQFIMLSGFSEFDYARKAMRYGVKHYLLKPCNEQLITQALAEVVDEWNHTQSKEQFMEKIESELKKVLPHAKEQFLKEFVTNKTYGKRDWDDYCSLFGIQLDDQKVRMLLFQLEGVFEFEHMFALKNIAEDILGDQTLLLSTTISKQVLLLIENSNEEELLFGLIDSIKTTFFDFYKIDVTIALSEAGDISQARSLFKETLACLNYRFYLGEGSLITKRDMGTIEEDHQLDFTYDEDKLCLLIKTGRMDDVLKEIEEFFEALVHLRMDTTVTKSYVIPMYMAIIRQGNPRSMHIYLKEFVRLDKLDTIQGLRDFVEHAAREITSDHYELTKNKQSSVINKVERIIHSNLHNAQLSLYGVANEMLYMNADYLGKLFKKETGERFSNYVMKARMEKAIELIGEMEDVRVFELAELLGFGDNPQYFSQVFKKHTGFTPTEFKRAP
ncbi:MAG: response regulator [Paenibacillaceae bacterium]